MRTLTLDLRMKKKGCTGDPIYRLSDALSKEPDKVIVLADPESLPLEVVSLIARVKGYTIVEHKTSKEGLRITIIKMES